MSGERRTGWLARVALVAGISFTLTLAVFGGVMFGEAVTSPDPPAPQLDSVRTTPAAPVAKGRAARPKPEPKPDPWPAPGAVAESQRIAKAREGVIAFAAIGPGGEEVAYEPYRQFYSASVSKAMLLVAELRRLRRGGLELDDSTRSTLEAMITLSDNDAADAIYARVGDAGLNEVASAAGMTHFSGDAGHWSNVKITPADMALFMSKLDDLLELPSGKVGSRMLSSVIAAQAWGIPAAAPPGAEVRFKGGWRPSDAGQLVHQAAQVEFGGEDYAIAVLTDGNPSQPYGEETIQLIARQLLR